MTPVDLLVASRDRVLDGLLGVRGSVLNSVPAQDASGDGGRVAVSLRQSINALIATASSSGAGRLDYARLADSPAYREYRTKSASLRTLDVTTLSSREARLAFWINVYNALVIDAVIAFRVRRSVTEGRLGVLAFFRRAAYAVGGHRLSCDDIEYGILRGNRGHPFIPGPHFGPTDPRLALVLRPPDARVHFALHCASRSCPPIRAYEAEQIDHQLDLAARGFVAADVEIDPSRAIVHLSRLFQWFASDFGGRAGLLRTLRQYLPDDNRRQWLHAHEGRARLAYRPYDWGLNAA
jgi:uncharacterized protein DUF547